MFLRERRGRHPALFARNVGLGRGASRAQGGDKPRRSLGRPIAHLSRRAYFNHHGAARREGEPQFETAIVPLGLSVADGRQRLLGREAQLGGVDEQLALRGLLAQVERHQHAARLVRQYVQMIQFIHADQLAAAAREASSSRRPGSLLVRSAPNCSTTAWMS